MTTRPILIIGGGIAGLAAARAIAREGREVIVAEQTPAWAPVGAGIVLANNAMRVVDHLGVGDAIRDHGRELSAATIADAAGEPMLDMGGTAELVAIHRADLHGVLLSGLEAEVRLGTTVDGLNVRHDAITARLRDGAVPEVDAVIGADGVQSRVRQLLHGPDAPRVVPAGQRVWRVVTRDANDLDRAVEQWGRGRRVGLIPMPAGRIYAFLVENEDATDPVADVTTLQRRFGSFGGPARTFLEALRSGEAVLRHDIAQLNRISYGRGRIVLIGDAAHAMTPNLGQGAAQALEDVPALIAALRDDAAELAEGVAALRTARVRTVVRRSARIGQVGQISSRFAVALRNTAVRTTPTSMARRAGRAVTGHDAVAAATQTTASVA